MFELKQARPRQRLIPNSSIFVSIFHKRLSMEIELETKKKLVCFPSKSGSMRNVKVGFYLIHQD
jgi:hypothetical protein